jgi:hypothetical protein
MTLGEGMSGRDTDSNSLPNAEVGWSRAAQDAAEAAHRLALLR